MESEEFLQKFKRTHAVYKRATAPKPISEAVDIVVNTGNKLKRGKKH